MFESSGFKFFKSCRFNFVKNVFFWTFDHTELLNTEHGEDWWPVWPDGVSEILPKNWKSCQNGTGHNVGC